MTRTRQKYVLDANLSPKTARFLYRQFGFDVLALQGTHLGQLPDHEVIRLARESRRIIITLDRDYSVYFRLHEPPGIGVVYLDLPNTHRYIATINAILERFFETLAPDIALESSLVTITPEGFTVYR